MRGQLFDERTIARFKAKYTETTEGCWIWKAARDTRGYGLFWHANHHNKAHRFSWMLANQQSIPEDLQVRHTCDCKPCVRPDHLILGTGADNKQDWLDRGFIPTNVCIEGHEMTEANTYYSIRPENGRQRRHCRACRKLAKLAMRKNKP